MFLFWTFPVPCFMYLLFLLVSMTEDQVSTNPSKPSKNQIKANQQTFYTECGNETGWVLFFIYFLWLSFYQLYCPALLHSLMFGSEEWRKIQFNFNSIIFFVEYKNLRYINLLNYQKKVVFYTTQEKQSLSSPGR